MSTPKNPESTPTSTPTSTPAVDVVCPPDVVLWIFRGLPGCGKTTAALNMVAHQLPGCVRVGRDPLRTLLYGGRHDQADPATRRVLEEQVTAAAGVLIVHFLRMGVKVICDDTNLEDRYVQALVVLAESVGAAWEVIDLRAEVALEVCQRRNAARSGEAKLPEEVITRLHQQHVAPMFEQRV